VLHSANPGRKYFSVPWVFFVLKLADYGNSIFHRHGGMARSEFEFRFRIRLSFPAPFHHFYLSIPNKEQVHYSWFRAGQYGNRHDKVALEFGHHDLYSKHGLLDLPLNTVGKLQPRTLLD
jgi:hypothetical protein